MKPSSSFIVSVLFSYLYQIISISATAELYENAHYCEPPKVGETYMGAPSQKGNALELFIDGKPLKKVRGFTVNSEATLKLKAPEWQQFVVYMKGSYAIFCIIYYPKKKIVQGWLTSRTSNETRFFCFL